MKRSVGIQSILLNGKRYILSRAQSDLISYAIDTYNMDDDQDLLIKIIELSKNKDNNETDEEIRNRVRPFIDSKSTDRPSTPPPPGGGSRRRKSRKTRRSKRNKKSKRNKRRRTRKSRR